MPPILSLHVSQTQTKRKLTHHKKEKKEKNKKEYIVKMIPFSPSLFILKY